MKKLWEKDAAPADWVARFTVGEDPRWDTLLLPYDIEGTRAHAWALAEIGVLTDEEFQQIEASLDRLRDAVLAGDVGVRMEDEDMHTVIEHHLTAELGEVGQKIHAGRSRNDQVLVALRLYLRAALRQIGRRTAALSESLCALGEANADLLMPGYTHLRHAMPSTAGLWAMGYAELLAADLDGLAAAARATDRSPWGSAAGYGVPHLDPPRTAVAERLGFDGMQTHVTAVQLSRGKFEAAIVHALVQVAATVNRLASDLVLMSAPEFGFVALPAAFCTGSSIMPQKQNPDVLELARATYHRLTAELHLLLTLPANLPSGYHRDLQLTKEAVVRSVRTTDDLLLALGHLAPRLRFDAERMRAACSPELFATEAALAQVAAGRPFRQAYRATAQALDTLDVPADPLAAYATDGGPGRLRPDLVRTALAAHNDWLDA